MATSVAIASIFLWPNDHGYRERTQRVYDTVAQVDADTFSDSTPADIRDNDLKFAQIRASEWKLSLSQRDANRPSASQLWDAISYYGSAYGCVILANSPAMTNQKSELLKQAEEDRVRARQALEMAKSNLPRGD